MTRRDAAITLALVACSAATALPAGVEIDHKAVGCIVVGKYPKMNACFSPAADLARSRVYFRPEGVQSWYYVDMKSDQPCFTGTLPKPGKKLVGKKIEYYVEAQNKSFEPARTAEFDPVVVKSAQECKKNIPVAPFLNNATVAVFPSVPAGFVGASTIGTAAVVGIVGAGAAAASTAVVVASNNNDDNTTTTIPVAINSTTTTTLAAVTTTTTTSTVPASPNKAPFAVLSTSPDPPSGNGPLTVTFDLCKSTDPDKDGLNFFFDFGDGGKSSGTCNASHTYSSSFRSVSNVRAFDKSYAAQACVVDSGGLSACRTREVNVTTTPPSTPPTTMCPPPVMTVNKSIPQSGCTIFFPSAMDANSTDTVEFCANPTPSCTSFNGTSSAAPPTVCGGSNYDSGSFYSPGLSVASGFCYTITAKATNGCGASTTSTTGETFASCSGFSGLRKSEGTLMVWASDLKLDGGRLQVVVNGSASSYPERGRSFGTTRIKDGDNRVEVMVVEAAGRAGLWTIDLSASAAIQAGSIRVMAGEIESIGAASVTFRLKGISGERVAFTFLKK